MRRLNYWVVGSVLVAFGSGGFIGWIVTTTGCADDCTTSAILIGLIAGLVAAVGVGVVVVLADRSLNEWRTAQVQGGPMPEPGCESEEHDPS